MFLKRYLTFWGMGDDVDAMAEEVVKTCLEISISEDGTMVYHGIWIGVNPHIW